MAHHETHYKGIYYPVVHMLRGLGLEGKVDIQHYNSERRLPTYQLEPIVTCKEARWLINTSINPIALYDYDIRNAVAFSAAGAKAYWRPYVWTQAFQDECDTVPECEKIYDVVHVGITDVGDRRYDIIKALEASGLKVLHISGKYNRESTECMKQAKVGLSIHRLGDNQAQEQLRIAHYLMAGLTVVSETSISPSIPTPIIDEYDICDIVEGVKKAVQSWTPSLPKEKLLLYKKYSVLLKARTWDESI